MHLAMQCLKRWSLILVLVSMTTAKPDVVEPPAGSACSKTSEICLVSKVPEDKLTFDFETETESLAVYSIECDLTYLPPNVTYCAVNVKELFNLNVDLFNVVPVLYIEVLCPVTHRLTINFTGDANDKQQEVNYSELWVIDCDMNLSDLGVLGGVVNLSRLALENWKEPQPIESGDLLGMATFTNPLHIKHDTWLPGLSNVYFVEITQNEQLISAIPHYFYTHMWPYVAELNISGVAVNQRELDLIQAAMPQLRQLDVLNNPSQDFPLSLWKPHQGLSQVQPIRKGGWYLTFQNNQITEITMSQFGGVIDRLVLSHNKISSISPNSLQDVTGLTLLDLSYNKISSLPKELLRKQILLKHLNLNHNSLHTLTEDHLKGLTALQRLSLNNNLLTNKVSRSHKGLNLSSVFFESSNVSEVYLGNNSLTRFPKGVLGAKKLSFLGLSGNNIDFKSLVNSVFCADIHEDTAYLGKADFKNYVDSLLYAKVDKKRIIDISNNIMENLDWNSAVRNENTEICKLNFEALLTYYDWNLSGNGLNCDCRAYPVYQIIRKHKDLVKKLYLDTWKCATPHEVKGRGFYNLSGSDFLCTAKIKDCPKMCSCSELAMDNSVYVNCSYRDLTLLPRKLPERTYHLNLRHNAIVSIDEFIHYERYKKLSIVDLGYNKVERIGDKVGKLLQRYEYVKLIHNRLNTLPLLVHNESATLYLSGNDFHCDCHSFETIKRLLENNDKIPDFNKIHCYLYGKGLKVIIQDVIGTHLKCRLAVGVQAAIGLAMLLLMSPLVFYLLYRYRLHIKVYNIYHFQSHPTSDSQVDHKLYDAYVAYGPGDLSLVRQKLIQNLECEENGFRLCVRDREFLPGRATTLNILNGMECSRRVIFCLTRRYLKTQWFYFEFRHAHMRVIEERARHIIVVLFDDIDPDDMIDKDLKVYLQTNSYVKNNDKHFIKKLCSAMPKKPHDKILDLKTVEDEFRFPFLNQENQYISITNKQRHADDDYINHNNQHLANRKPYQ